MQQLYSQLQTGTFASQLVSSNTVQLKVRCTTKQIQKLRQKMQLPRLCTHQWFSLPVKGLRLRTPLDTASKQIVVTGMGRNTGLWHIPKSSREVGRTDSMRIVVGNHGSGGYGRCNWISPFVRFETRMTDIGPSVSQSMIPDNYLMCHQQQSLKILIFLPKVSIASLLHWLIRI